MFPTIGLSSDEVLTTTRAVRQRLDLDRAVPRQLVEECLQIAFQAPNGSNEQSWNWIVVDDLRIKREMADIYRRARDDHRRILARRASPRVDALRSATDSFASVLHRVPVLLVPTIGERYGSGTTFEQASKWGSILPAVWSFMLALRSRGLGSCWTTVHLHREAEMASLLGIPHPEQTQAGLFPVAYTIGNRFSAADRAGSEAGIRWNGWHRPGEPHVEVGV